MSDLREKIEKELQKDYDDWQDGSPFRVVVKEWTDRIVALVEESTQELIDDRTQCERDRKADHDGIRIMETQISLLRSRESEARWIIEYSTCGSAHPIIYRKLRDAWLAQAKPRCTCPLPHEYDWHSPGCPCYKDNQNGQ